jgi:hypothetical protein
MSSNPSLINMRHFGFIARFSLLEGATHTHPIALCQALSEFRALLFFLLHGQMPDP